MAPSLPSAPRPACDPGEWVALEHADLHLRARAPFLVVERAMKADGTPDDADEYELALMNEGDVAPHGPVVSPEASEAEGF